MIIRINDLRLSAFIGVYEWEMHYRQELIVNVEFEFASLPAGQSDDLADTIDYTTLAEQLGAKASERHYNLLETLAGKLVEEVLVDDRIRRATVSVEKAGAIADARSVSVIASSGR